MNGLTEYELRTLANIRKMAAVDLWSAKRYASRWMMKNKRRRVIREAACRTVRGLYSHLKENYDE
jgi:hypothetical protein